MCSVNRPMVMAFPSDSFDKMMCSDLDFAGMG